MSRSAIHIFDTPQLAPTAAGDTFRESMADFGSKLAGLATGRTMHPVYDQLIQTETQSNGLFLQINFAQVDEVVSNHKG